MTIGLERLEQELYEELDLLELPADSWLPPQPDAVLDVAIIGAGMAGLAAAFALMKEGISNIRLFDARPEAFEGSWITYARMQILRSPKHLAGPALDIPKLTFQAWYIAQFGQEAWESLYKIPTSQWMDYLRWYRKVLQIPVTNNVKITSVMPHKGTIELKYADRKIYARKVVLATGRDGFGGFESPSFLKDVPKTYYAHTIEPIEFDALKDKAITIVGSSASAFDAAAVALEAGCASVTQLSRRKKLAFVNKFSSL
ncbi:MAG TPA: NAD(P)-binding domain-containing protein, partial [Chlamydiales bacterium]|nr:NAD(P)-binding domain-containing protein [Chlamydiales bacterium]